MRNTALILFITLTISCTQGNNYYVSPDGSDSNPGTLKNPFKTVQKAIDLAKAIDTCFLLQGRYHESVIIRNLQGEENEPVVIIPYKKAEVWMDGSIPIEGNWALKQGNIYALKLNEPIWQLFVDGKSISSARWPNGNWNDGSIWDKTTSMCWPEKGKGGLGEHYNAELKW